MLPVIVMMNNYFHDLATAVLLASAVATLLLVRVLGPSPSPDAVAVVLRLYPALTRLARIALVWIILGGIPRALYFRQLEWWDAAQKGVLPALGAKHMLMFTVVALGAWKWREVSRQVAALREAQGS